MDTTNFIRIRGESGEAEPYSAPVTLAIDAAPDPLHQLRAPSLSRTGANLEIRWDVVQDLGQLVFLYFVRADGTDWAPRPLSGPQPGSFGPPPRASTPSLGPGSPKPAYTSTRTARR